MSKATFSTGDLVELKSSSPIMTIMDGPRGDDLYYTCTWFSGKKNERASFPEATLKKAEEDE